MSTSKQVKRIVVVGGGFGGIRLIKGLKNVPDYQVTLLDKHNYHTFQPLLYQVASGGLGADAIAYPYRKIFAGYRNFQFRLANVERVEPETNTLHTSIGALTYDILVIGTGSRTNFYGQNNLAKWCMELKTIPQALDLRSDILQEFERALTQRDPEEQRNLLNFVIVGGGPTGVETAGALAEFKRHVIPQDYPELDPDMMQVHLVESGDKVLGVMSDGAANKTKDYLEELGVRIHLMTKVKDFDGETLFFENGETIRTRTVLWSAGVRGALIAGLASDSILRGSRVLTDANNLVKGYNNIYAIGDMSAMPTDAQPNGHPMVAQVAIQQAANLANNLKNDIKGRQRIDFKYKDLGSMATIGRHRAVVDLPWVSFQGRIAWFVWMFVHLMTLVSFRNRVIVFTNWLWNYVSYDRAIRLIIRPFSEKTTE